MHLACSSIYLIGTFLFFSSSTYFFEAALVSAGFGRRRGRRGFLPLGDSCGRAPTSVARRERH
jgi:hypothetical protein